MPVRHLRCAIEQLVDWHATLFVEPHLVAFVAVASVYSRSPARIAVECNDIRSRWLGSANEFRLEVSWHNDTAEKAERLRATMQPAPLLELASIALALILTKRVVRLGRLDVTDYGTRADYRARKRKTVLEVSGTEVAAEFARRHREKVAQARDNPFGWSAYVVVCGFSARGHEVYVYPPLNEVHYSLGEVIRKKADHSDIRVILTPHCYLAIQTGQTAPRAEFVVTVKTRPVVSVLGQKLTSAKAGNEGAFLKKVGTWINPPSHEQVGKPEGRYWYLPQFLDIPHVYCDFLQVESLPYAQLEQDYEELAVLTPPFAESLQACYGAFHGSVGIPNVKPASVAHTLGLLQHRVGQPPS